MAKIVLDLHDIYNKGFKIEAELNRVIVEAIEKKIALVEIIPGKGSGRLGKRVLRFLPQLSVNLPVKYSGLAHMATLRYREEVPILVPA